MKEWSYKIFHYQSPGKNVSNPRPPDYYSDWPTGPDWRIVRLATAFFSSRVFFSRVFSEYSLFIIRCTGQVRLVADHWRPFSTNTYLTRTEEDYPWMTPWTKWVSGEFQPLSNHEYKYVFQNLMILFLRLYIYKQHCEENHGGIFGQRGFRSACAIARSDQSLRSQHAGSPGLRFSLQTRVQCLWTC